MEEDGTLLHKSKFGAKEGKLAGSLTPQGYRRIKVGGRLFLAHRIAYKMHHGIDPGEKEVDHVNGEKSDNRVCNLRLATRSQNRQNVGAYANNSLGLRGVYYSKNRKGYMCSVQCEGSRAEYGPYATPEAARDVYTKHAKALFGEFYRKECHHG